MEENKENNVKLDNVEMNYSQFDERLRNLKNNEKIIETSENNYFTITRMRG